MAKATMLFQIVPSVIEVVFFVCDAIRKRLPSAVKGCNYIYCNQ